MLQCKCIRNVKSVWSFYVGMLFHFESVSSRFVKGHNFLSVRNYLISLSLHIIPHLTKVLIHAFLTCARAWKCVRVWRVPHPLACTLPAVRVNNKAYFSRDSTRLEMSSCTQWFRLSLVREFDPVWSFVGVTFCWQLRLSNTVNSVCLIISY